MVMNNKIIFFVVFVFSTVFLVACGSAIPSLKPYHVEVQQGNVVDAKMMAQLRPGMSKSQVRYILGTPLIQDSFHQNRWDYFYQIRKDGQISEQRRVILDFENDALKNIRGDVVPAGTKSDTDDASMATLPSANTSVPANKELQKQEENKKGFWDHLNFWGDDDPPTSKAIPAKPEAPIKLETPAKPETPIKPEEDKKSLLEKLPEDDTKPTPATNQSSDAASIPLNKVAGANATEVADVEQQKSEVTAVVNAWADAWRNKDVKNYLAAYSDHFVADGFASKKAWAAQRKLRLTKAGKITLSLDNMNIDVNDQLAKVIFNQAYSASNFSDNVSKELQLAYSANRWLIVKESIISKVAQSAKSQPAKNQSADDIVTTEAEQAQEQAPQPITPSTEPAQMEAKDAAAAAPTPKDKQEKKDSATKQDRSTQTSEPSLFERMLEKIGF